MGENTLGSELLDLVAPILVPVLNVLVLAHTEGSASVDESGDSVLVASADDELLVLLGSTSLNGGDETGSNPLVKRISSELERSGLASATHRRPLLPKTSWQQVHGHRRRHQRR